MPKSASKTPSDHRIDACTAILARRLPVDEGQDIREACPSPEGAPHSSSRAKAGTSSSKRSVYHRGHLIEIQTSYEISVDGRPFERALYVSEAGQVNCHALPYRQYGSPYDLVREFLDAYPDAYPTPKETE